jgi:hypothetical protein
MKTMKKTYINPELEVVKLQTMQMMATSVIEISETAITEPSDIGAREFTLDEENLELEEDFESYE